MSDQVNIRCRQFTPFERAMNKGYDAYKSSNPENSEFMETDYKTGFADGYRAATNKEMDKIKNQEWIIPPLEAYSIQEVPDTPQFIPSPLLSVAMSVMQGLLSNQTWMSNEAKAALEKTGGNEKEGGKLLMKTIVSDSLELADEFLAQISQGK